MLFISAAWVLPGRADAVLTASSTDGVKIGYVDFSRSLNEVSDGVVARKRLKDEFRERQQRLDRLQGEVNTMKERLDHDRMLLSADAIAARDEAYRRKVTEVQQLYADFKKGLDDRETHLTQEILSRLRDIVRAIGEREGYAIILERSQEVVLYTPRGDDLTDRVIAQYNGGVVDKRR
jgi:Skp family chaperone for outer membrane proteins